MTSFDQLNTRLKVGDTVWVTDAQGHEVEGMITELHEASITLTNGGPTTLQADNVRLVQKRTKSVGKAALWGLLIGGVAGAVGDGTGGCESDCLSIGWAVGAGWQAALKRAVPETVRHQRRLTPPSGRERPPDRNAQAVGSTRGHTTSNSITNRRPPPGLKA